MLESETETSDLRIIEWESRMKCCEKYRMEIAESKAMMIIERGGQVDAEEAMWREIRALRWSFGIEGTSVIFSQA